jgi:hypothetical protein
MVASSEGRVFDLDTDAARATFKDRRFTRYMMAAIGAVFLALTVYAAVGLPHALTDSSGVIGVYLFALVLITFLTWFALSLAIVNSGRPASQLILTTEGPELRFDSRRVGLAWSDRRFSLRIRDFRGHPTPASSRVQIERIGRAPFWLQRPTSPLTPAAYDALISASREHGLTVTEERGGTAFNFWPNTEVTIRRAPPR